MRVWLIRREVFEQEGLNMTHYVSSTGIDLPSNLVFMDALVQGLKERRNFCMLRST